MNRDQTINKFIQKTIEIASGKIEKTIKRKTLFSSPGAKPARGLLGHPSLGPRPDSERPGRRNSPPRCLLPPPAWAACQPRKRGAISTVDLDRTVARAVRRIKTDDAGVSRNPSDSFSLPLLSPRDAAAATERRRRPWRPRRRGRSGAVPPGHHGQWLSPLRRVERERGGANDLGFEGCRIVVGF